MTVSHTGLRTLALESVRALFLRVSMVPDTELVADKFCWVDGWVDGWMWMVGACWKRYWKARRKEADELQRSEMPLGNG